MALLPFGSPIKRLRQLWSSAPSTPTSTGTTGDAAYDADYLYVAIDTNTWKRTALSTWAVGFDFTFMDTVAYAFQDGVAKEFQN